MKLKLLLIAVEKFLGIANNGDEPRADMYLPERLLAMSVIFLGIGVALAVYFAVFHVIWAIVAAIAALAFGVAALLCWRNQTIRVISDKEFAYTTMFGKTYTYSFSDIQGLRKNRDSMTLFVAGKKVHIESMAILTERLVDNINSALKKLG